MQFVVNRNSGEDILILDGESYNHVFKSRRTKSAENLYLRNLEDINLYRYSIVSIDRKSAKLKLEEVIPTENTNKPVGHIILSVIDIKNIEKILPFLNEINLRKLSLFYADFSQKNFIVNFDRFYRILDASSEQCGRIKRMELELLDNIEEVIIKYNNLSVLDFGGDSFGVLDDCSVLIGCEGGFSQRERDLLNGQKIYSINNANILRAESAAMYIASRFGG